MTLHFRVRYQTRQYGIRYDSDPCLVESFRRLFRVRTTRIRLPPCVVLSFASSTKIAIWSHPVRVRDRALSCVTHDGVLKIQPPSEVTCATLYEEECPESKPFRSRDPHRHYTRFGKDGRRRWKYRFPMTSEMWSFVCCSILYKQRFYSYPHIPPTSRMFAPEAFALLS